MSEQGDLPVGQSSSENEQKQQDGKKEDNDSRYAKTFQVFQQMGLLEYTLEMAKLCKENEQLQMKIDKLEKEVNESSQKARQGLKEKMEEVAQTTANATVDVPKT